MSRATEVQSQLRALGARNSKVPDKFLRACRQRWASLRGRDGKKSVCYDEEMERILKLYGGARVNAIIPEVKEKEISCSTVNFDEFQKALEAPCTQETVRNLVGQQDYEAALKVVANRVQKTIGSIKPLDLPSVADLEDLIPKKTANAGATGIICGVRSKVECLSEARDAAKFKLQNLGRVEYDPAVPGHKNDLGHITDDDDEEFGHLSCLWKCKSRFLWMISFADVIVEMLTAQPFISRFVDSVWYAGGKSGAQIGSFMNRWRSQFRNWCTLDYSKYDTSIPSWLIRDVFKIISSVFDVQYVPEAYWKFIYEGFTFTRVVDAESVVRRTTHGVPSGSYYTQVVDTIANMVMVTTYLIHESRMSGKPMPRFECMIMGDDNIIFTNDCINVGKLSFFLKTRFGITVNEDKSTQGLNLQDPEFLSRVWTRDGARRDVREVVTKLLVSRSPRVYRGGLTPQIVLWALTDVYPVTMKRYFRLGGLGSSLGNKITEVSVVADTGVLPGVVAYQQQYLADNMVLLLGHKQHPISGTPMRDLMARTA